MLAPVFTLPVPFGVSAMLALAVVVLIVIVPPVTTVVFTLPAVTLPVTDTNPPVKLAVFTMVVNMPLLAVTLPVTDTKVPV